MGMLEGIISLYCLSELRAWVMMSGGLFEDLVTLSYVSIFIINPSLLSRTNKTNRQILNGAFGPDNA